MINIFAIDPSIIQAIKILGHIALPAIITIGMLKMRFHPVFCVIVAVCLISGKEIMDFNAINFIEYDDILMNFCGSAIGCITKIG